MLFILHFPNRCFSKVIPKRLWSNQASLQRSWEVAHAPPEPCCSWQPLGHVPCMHSSCRSVQHWVTSGGAVFKRVAKVSKTKAAMKTYHERGVIILAVLMWVLGDGKKKGTWGQMVLLFDSLLKAVWSRNQKLLYGESFQWMAFD